MSSVKLIHKYVLFAAVLILCGGGAFLIRASHSPVNETPLVGMVRKTEVRMAPEVSGYLTELRVKKGDVVHAGDVLAVLYSPEITAAVQQAQMALDQAKAAQARVYAGVRDEEIESAKKEVEKRRSNLKLAQLNYDRVKDLLKKDDASEQEYDEFTTQLSNAHSALQIAEATLASAVKGATDEEKAMADRSVDLAQALLKVALVRQSKLILYAPDDAVVWNVVAQTGEAITLGQAILTLQEKHGTWFTFNIREDFLGGINIGTVLSLRTGNGETVQAVVNELRNLGDFAVWSAEQASSYDLATFEIRASLIEGTSETLHAGMTAWILQNE